MTTALLDRPHTATTPRPTATDRKQCIKCGEHKPAEAFSFQNKNRPARRTECKPCRVASAREKRRPQTAARDRRRNAHIRDVLELHPRSVDAARELGVHIDTVRKWKLAIAKNPNVVLRTHMRLPDDEEPEDTPPPPEPTGNVPTRPTGERPLYGWQLHAGCRGKGTDLWFGGPERPGQGRPAGVLRDQEDATAQAKKICITCPVKAACLAEAFYRDEQHGIWGGLTTDERKALQPDDTSNPGP